MNPRDHFLLYFALFRYCFAAVVVAVTFPLSHCKLLKSGIKISEQLTQCLTHQHPGSP